MRAKLPDKESFIERDSVKVHYEIYGQGKHTLLFMPAFPIGHSRMWKGQLPFFSQHYRCIAFDPRGNGKSDRPSSVDAYRIDEFVADALAILDQESIEKAIVIGLSFGAVLSAALAANHPKRVRAAVMIGGAFPIKPDYGFLTPENFNAQFNNPQGWQKYNRHYWESNYRDFVEFFTGRVFSEPHSTKQFEDGVEWGMQTSGDILARTVLARLLPSARYKVGLQMFSQIKCPLLLIHGEEDQIQPAGKSKVVAEITGAELVLLPRAGHLPAGRFPAKINTLIRNFLDRTLTPSVARSQSERGGKRSNETRVLYLSSPIGLGHARRDLSITQDLRTLRPDVKVDWLAQDPVTRLLKANNESIHPASSMLANESRHLEEEAGEHDLNCFQSLRRMDEILVANFMVFQEVLERQHYDLVIADEAWDVDHFWHEHPELKRTQLAWFTDFVGFLPMPEGGEHEAYLTADYNLEMIQHVERSPRLRDRAIFVGSPEDIVPGAFGPELPLIREWTEEHFDFCGYITGFDPKSFGTRDALRAQFGYRSDEKVCIVTVGGSGVGAPLLRRILAAYPAAKSKLPELKMIIVAGPRIDPESLDAPSGVEVHAFVADLHKHLAACDLALVQGGLTTCMELTAAGTPFIYFPLRNHFEQNFHVHHRLQRYCAGRRLDYAAANPDAIADSMVQELNREVRSREVETDGAKRAATMLAEML
ncbi:MAG: alpha/beta fold hydrolase [Betaproteobacteria bacterium]|nr:MAG: alpha/beta fold hydrolase [Betaproteobacteria bacterium]